MGLDGPVEDDGPGWAWLAILNIQWVDRLYPIFPVGDTASLRGSLANQLGEIPGKGVARIEH